MSQKVAIDHGFNRWKEKLGDQTISIEEIKQTYKMFHTKDIGTKHLDYNIRLTFGKTKFKDQLANLWVHKTFVTTVRLTRLIALM